MFSFMPRSFASCRGRCIGESWENIIGRWLAGRTGPLPAVVDACPAAPSALPLPQKLSFSDQQQHTHVRAALDDCSASPSARMQMELAADQRHVHAHEIQEAVLFGSHGCPPPDGDEEEGVAADEEGVDWGVPPLEVVRRIESATLWLLDRVAAGQLPDFEVVRQGLAGCGTHGPVGSARAHGVMRRGAAQYRARLQRQALGSAPPLPGPLPCYRPFQRPCPPPAGRAQVSRAASNRSLERAEGGDAGGGGGGAAAAQPYTLRLRGRPLARSLAGRHPDSADQAGARRQPPRLGSLSECVWW